VDGPLDSHVGKNDCRCNVKGKQKLLECWKIPSESEVRKMFLNRIPNSLTIRKRLDKLDQLKLNICF
jgi:hypothetical protein